MKTINLLLFIAVFFILFCTGCTSLKVVHGYSETSFKTLQEFEKIDYGFLISCNTKCKIEQLEKQQLFKEACDCTSNITADSVTLILYNTINGYFNVLTKLSDNTLTDYKFNTKVLTQGSFGDVVINKQDVEAHTTISTILLKAFTDTYRKKKISGYIGEANAPLQTLIATFNFTLEANLSKKLYIEKQRYQNYYFDLFHASNISAYEKSKIIETYDLTITQIAKRKNELALFGKGLRKIAAGHQKLFDNRNKLTATNLKQSLAEYGVQLLHINTELSILKN